MKKSASLVALSHVAISAYVCVRAFHENENRQQSGFCAFCIKRNASNRFSFAMYARWPLQRPLHVNDFEWIKMRLLVCLWRVCSIAFFHSRALCPSSTSNVIVFASCCYYFSSRYNFLSFTCSSSSLFLHSSLLYFVCVCVCVMPHFNAMCRILSWRLRMKGPYGLFHCKSNGMKREIIREREREEKKRHRTEEPTTMR